MKFFKAFAREFAIPVATAFVVIAFAVQAFKIPSGSMENTLFEGDFLLGLKFVYGIPIPFSHGKIPVSSPDTGDVVIFRYPGEPEYPDYDYARYSHIANALMFGNFFWDGAAPAGFPRLVHYADGPKDYIKRCVAKSGQRVAVRDGRLFVDGAEKPLKGLGKYTEKLRGNSPRDYMKETRLPMPGETIAFDTLSAHDLWMARMLMVQEMPDSLVEFGIKLSKGGKELKDYKFENFMVPIENHKWMLVNYILSQNRAVAQSLRMGDTIGGEMDLGFLRKFARTGFIPRHDQNYPQKSLFGSRLVGYDAFDGSHLEDLEANVAFENARFAAGSDSSDSGDSGERSEPLELEWQILVNGKAVSHYTVKGSVYFMMGDNRDNSADSRYWGFVSERNIKAKAFIIYFSLDKDSGAELLKPWTWIYLPADIRWSRIARIIHLI